MAKKCSNDAEKHAHVIEGESLYILDPDGHRLELHCGTLATRLAELTCSPYKGLVWC